MVISNDQQQTPSYSLGDLIIEIENNLYSVQSLLFEVVNKSRGLDTLIWMTGFNEIIKDVTR